MIFCPQPGSEVREREREREDDVRMKYADRAISGTNL